MAHTALITGASRGIGKGIALSLAALGYDLVLTARDEAALAATATAATAAGAGQVAPLAVDLGDPLECRRAAEAALTATDRPPDVFVHSAGIGPHGAIGELSLEDWNATQQLNVTAAFVIAGVLGPRMAAAGWGRIVTVGSLYSRFGTARTAAYTASKHALLGLTRVLAAEYVTKGVTANTVNPGYVDTELVRRGADRVAAETELSHEQVIERFLRAQPLGRMVTVDEVGALVAYLCGDAAAPITGQAVGIDGGAYHG